ncbi:MAG TPA: serine/threonine-protein phosphatase [Clostridiales bacterium]|nr:MAG: hypothetical protein A2Y22_04380 [Clostridiales bacterium GWD2_32_59]HAN09276.1 serine/threonine-protein phosphatase [Clostridiales bacterium]
MQVYGISDKGKTRNKNEDRIFYTDKPIGKLPNLFIVADGVGGTIAGEIASSFATEKFCQCIIENKDDDSPLEILAKGIVEVNKYIHYKSTNSYEFQGMATTFLAATIINDKIYAINIGDCRLYLLSKNTITQITEDNSYYNEMKNILEIETLKINKNILSRAVGQLGSLNVDTYEVEYTKDTNVIMCSDGLYKMLGDIEILDIYNTTQDVKSYINLLIKEANQKGGQDNISVIGIG